MEPVVDYSNEVKQAAEIFYFIEDLMKANNNVNHENVFVETRKRYGQFCTKHPVIVKCMIVYGRFSDVAFKKYTNQMNTTKKKGYDEFLNMQSKYFKYFIAEIRPSASKADVKKWQRKMYEELKMDKKNFDSELEEVRKVVMIEDQQRKDFRRKMVKAALLELANQPDQPGLLIKNDNN